jgi:excisionase family DNA binding protein
MRKKLGISRPIAYQLANSEGFPAVRIGRRLVIPVAAFEKWLTEHAGAGNVLPG